MAKKRNPDFKKRPSPNKPVPSTPIKEESVEGMRLNKYIAHSGVCSRRQAAEYVKEGLVTVNGQTVLEPFYQVKATDKIAYKGKPVKPEARKVYILMNKPKGVITTVSDERGRKTVMEIIGSSVRERLYPVGRLDRDTTGLLLLTNDGDLAKKLSHPSHKVKKVYQVQLDRPLEEDDLRAIRKGLELEDGIATVDKISLIDGGGGLEAAIELHIGKNRIVRRIFEKLGYEVKKLDRSFYGGLTKKDLPRGHFRDLNEREIIMLKHFV